MRHQSCQARKPKFTEYTYLKPKICQNGHLFWVRAYTTVKSNKRHPEFCAHNTSDRIPHFSSSRYPHQHSSHTSSDRIRLPHPSPPTEPYLRMCSQPQFLHSPKQLKDNNFWKSKNPWNHSETFTNSENKTTLNRSNYPRTNTPLNRSKIDHQHRQNYLISETSWNSFRHLHLHLTKVLLHLQCPPADNLIPVPARQSLQQQLRQQSRCHGIIRTIITPAAAAVTILHTSINTILIGGSMIFITINMDINSSL
jgi:hypothetical protein